MQRTNTVAFRKQIAINSDFTPQERDFILRAVNMLEPQDAIMRDDPSYLGRIEALWGWFSIGEHGEGLCAAPFPGGITAPLIAADKRRLDGLRPMAEHISKLFGKPVRLAKFSKREDLEIIQP